jgi:hypothetical protein
MRAKKLRDRGTVAQRHEADALLAQPGDMVLVLRGVLRSAVMLCPDGCGEIITVNLDPRTAKAWRFYRRHNKISVFPSVWRDTGCKSHFILWNDVIVWCNFHSDSDSVVVDELERLKQKISAVLDQQWRHYTDIAQDIEEVPWDVDWACRHLVKHDVGVEAAGGSLRGNFRRRAA